MTRQHSVVYAAHVTDRTFISLRNKRDKKVSWELHYSGIDVNLAMEPARSKELKGSHGESKASLLVMGNLIEPYANVEFTFLGEPTIYSPYEYSVKNYIISFDIMDIWIYDNESGQVLARLRKRD